MKKNLEFGGAWSQVVLSARTGEIFNYETDRERLVETYGGKNYYTSKTGLSGAGYLDFSKSENDLVDLGTYRSDIRSSDAIDSMVFTKPLTEVWNVAVPLRGHDGIDRTNLSPIVLVDNRRRVVVFLDQQLFKDFILGSYDPEDDGPKKININLVRRDGLDWTDQVEMLLINPRKMRGVNMLRFIHLPEISGEPEELEDGSRFWKYSGVECWESGSFPKTFNEIGITPMIRMNAEGEVTEYFLRNLGVYNKTPGYREMYFDDVFGKKELTSSETEFGKGFRYSEEGGFFYTRRDEHIYMFIEAHQNGGKLLNGEELWAGKNRHNALDEYVEYEIEVPILEFYRRGIAEFKRDLREGLNTKSILSFRYRESVKDCHDMRDRIKELVRSNPDVFLTELDSTNGAGNCAVGTRRFVEGYKLPDFRVSFRELAAHERFDEMFRNEHFVRAVRYRIQEEGIA